jgi:hypothetical protein
MAVSKLSELVFTLNRYERPEFEKYLSSPFFNNDKSLLKAFDFLSSADVTVLDRKALFIYVYGEQKKFDDKTARYICSNLQKHLEQYVTLKSWMKDNRAYRNSLCRELSARRCSKSWQYHALQEKETTPELNADHYYHRYVFSQTEYIHHAKSISRTNQLRYDQMSNHLDQFYCLRKLQLACELINMNNVLQTDFKQHLITEIIHLLKQNGFFNSALIEIYYCIYQLLSEPDEIFLERLRILLSKNENSIGVSELKDIYQYIKNFYVKKINTGQPEYLKTLLDLYKSYIANERLMRHDYFSPWEFKNIVTIALRLNEVTWTTNFIKKYISYLAPEERKNANQYNTAVLHYHTGEFRKSIQYLQQVEFTDIYYALDSRSFLLKNYFELDETEILFYHISAYKVYLKRNRLISSYQRTIYSNYLKYVGKIVRAGINRKKLLSIKSALEKEKAISDKRWLMEKVEGFL